MLPMYSADDGSGVMSTTLMLHRVHNGSVGIGTPCMLPMHSVDNSGAGEST